MDSVMILKFNSAIIYSKISDGDRLMKNDLFSFALTLALIAASFPAAAFAQVSGAAVGGAVSHQGYRPDKNKGGTAAVNLNKMPAVISRVAVGASLGILNRQYEPPLDTAEIAAKKNLLAAPDKMDTMEVKTIIGAHPKFIDIRDGRQRTPLMLALNAGDQEFAWFLIAAGADVGPCDEFKYSALRYAILKCSAAMVKIVLDQGPALDTPDNFGNTALITAVNMKDHEVAKMLLTAGARVDLNGPAGITPLMAAAFEGDVKMIELLLEKGADINLKNAAGRTALEIAKLAKNDEAAKLLETAGTK